MVLDIEGNMNLAVLYTDAANTRQVKQYQNATTTTTVPFSTFTV